MTIEHSLGVVTALAIELQPPLVLDSSSNVGHVIGKMQDSGLGYALITEREQLVGIFTERDVLRSVLGNEQSLHEPVAKHMTTTPISVRDTDSLSQVVARMHDGGYRQIPVVDEDHKVLGCVRHKDIAEHLVNHFASHVLNLPPDPEQVASTPEGG